MRVSLPLVFLVYLLLAAGSLFAQDRNRRLDSLFTALYDSSRFTGNVLIAENGAPIFQKSYGMAFREMGLELDSNSVFELASVSKQFTAMGIMLLKKAGRLSYEDSLRKFIPELPYHSITVRQLLQHTSGLPDYESLSEKEWDRKQIMTNDAMIRLLAEKQPPCLFAPGEKWEYSNTGYALLASIIERVSGMSFPEYMSRYIFRPLGMDRTTVYRKRYEKRVLENYAYGYVKDSSGRFVMADSLPATATLVYSLDGIFGDGVVNSTTGDLLKWDQALYTGKLVSQDMLQEAFTDAVLNNGKSFPYGFGWFLLNHENFGRIMNHSGGWPGYVTWMERHPRDNKTIILLANGGAANGSIKAIRNIIYDMEEVQPVEISLPASVLKQYEGSYLFIGNNSSDTLKVFLEAGKLFGEGAGQSKHQLRPQAPDLFFREDRDYRLQFTRDAAGKVKSLQVLREVRPIEAEKVQ